MNTLEGVILTIAYLHLNQQDWTAEAHNCSVSNAILRPTKLYQAPHGKLCLMLTLHVKMGYNITERSSPNGELRAKIMDKEVTPGKQNQGCQITY